MQAQSTNSRSSLTAGLRRSLGLLDSTMIVAGSMIGTGIYIVSAEMSRQVGRPGWLLASWVVTGLLTIAAALSYGELAAMMPHAGGQYVYLREAWSPLWGFLYGWTLFLVIQTGTAAAVGIGFARYLGILWPRISEQDYLIPPVHISSKYGLTASITETRRRTAGGVCGNLMPRVGTPTRPSESVRKPRRKPSSRKAEGEFWPNTSSTRRLVPATS